jgi:hypothetical protein
MNQQLHQQLQLTAAPAIHYNEQLHQSLQGASIKTFTITMNCTRNSLQ